MATRQKNPPAQKHCGHQDDDVLYLHPRCCAARNAHWDLRYENGTYSLVCEFCGRPAPQSIVVTGPVLEGARCECCAAEEASATRH